MRLPRSLLARLGVALAVAVAAIVVLDRLAAGWDRRQKLPPPHRGSTAPAEPVAAAHVRPLQLGAVNGRIALVRQPTSLSPDVAPVVELLADGSLILRRPPALARSPGDPGAPTSHGIGAGVVIPADLESLSARARGALLLVLGQLVGDRPLPMDRIEVVDFPVTAAQLRGLLSWLP